MADREKVIRGLECVICPNIFCGDCSYFIRNENDPDTGWCDRDAIYKDALSLLKEQEPRVMTFEEVKQHNNQDGCVWFEQPTYNADASFVIQDEECTEIISPYILGEPINHGYWSNSNYNLTWRCWTSRPTDEQRGATPWE